MAAKPVVTYAATEWWTGVKFKTSKVKLNKLHRIAYLGITGLTKTAPTAAIESLPLHLQLEAAVTAGVYKLYCSDQWKPKSEGFRHAHMTQGMKKEHILHMGTDRMIQKHVHSQIP
jgi:hypothetical protein